MRFYLSIKWWIKCYIFPTSVESRFANHYNKEDHRGIGKTVGDVCGHVPLIPTSTLESRDEIPVRGVDL